ncbi:MAG: DUF4343 domain-containing protein [Spirochaetes bacterium]|nr:MAG: DUF4343 domain-containing protein [Spirochaetota bacterium]
MPELETPTESGVEREFRVVTRQNWIAEHFSVAGGVHDFGFDVDPETVLDTVWWAPGAWAAAVADIGFRISVLSCGADWLDNVPQRYTRRKIVTVPASQASEVAKTWGLKRLFVKLPEVKTDVFPAHICDVDRLEREIDAYAGDIAGKLFSHTKVQLSEALLEQSQLEARFFISDGNVSHGSVYQIGYNIWGHETLDMLMAVPLNAEFIADTLTRMREFVRELLSDTDHPPGFVVDVGALSDESLILIEANAAWSSNPYTTDPSEAKAAIVSAHDFNGEHARWRFDTDQVPRPRPRVQECRSRIGRI